jgi:hypothetical protein
MKEMTGDRLTKLKRSGAATPFRGVAEYFDCLALLSPSQRNWFRKSHLMSMVAIGLQKLYAKIKVGKSCTCMMFIDSVDGC